MTPNPVVGEVRVSNAFVQNMSITNVAPAGTLTEGLDVSFGAPSDVDIAAAGSIASLAGQATDNTSMTIGVNTAAAGNVSGTVAVNLQSDGSINTDGPTPLAGQTIAVDVDVFQLAGAGSGTPVDLGAVRVGDAAVANLTITNTAVGPLGFVEDLDAAFTSTTGGDTASVAGLVDNLAAGQTDATAMAVTLDTASAGAKSGTAEINFISDPDGINSLGQFDLGNQTATATVDVYAAAIANTQPLNIDLGVMRVGDASNTAAVTVTNAQTAQALNDVLRESGRTVDAPFDVAGTVGDLAASESATLTASMSTATSGIITGEALFSYVSHNDAMADLSLGTQTIALTGQVNNLAEALFEQIGGNGSLSGGGTSWLLSFGDVEVDQGLVSLGSQLGVRNGAAGPAADNLSGDFDLPGTSPFGLAGFDSFSSLAFGQLLAGLFVSFDFDTDGMAPQVIRDSLILNPLSVFPTLADISLDGITLALQVKLVEGGVAVPETDTLLLLIAGLLVLLCLSRPRNLVRLGR